MRSVVCMVSIACRNLFVRLAPPEDAEVETEHIECRHGSNACHDPAYYRTELEASGQNLVLREEARERRNAGNGQASNQEGDVGNRHILAETAHGTHLIAVYRMDDATGTKEQQRLEHGVGEQVEHARHITQTSMMWVIGSTDTQCHNHEANL